MKERVTSSARSRAVASARRCSSRMAVNPRGAYNAGRTQMMGTQTRYAIVIEKAERNYAAYVPDLPGCVATGATIEETERSIREALDIHVEVLRADGLPIPDPSSRVEYVDVTAQERSPPCRASGMSTAPDH